MIGFLYFILAIVLILMAVRLLPLAWMVGGCWWLWEAHRSVLIGALLLGALIGIWRSLHNQDQPAIHPPSSTGLPTRHRLRQRLRRGLFR
jgi:multisubunit Na+/H+ antiporter MnhB subunit